MSCWSRPLKGWLAGCGAATAVICAPALPFLVIGQHSIGSLASGLAILPFAVALVFAVTMVMSGFPAVLTIWFAKRFGIRSIWFFGCLGAMMGVLGAGILLGGLRDPSGFATLGWIFAVPGFVAGLTYRSVAVKDAGCDRGVLTDAA